MHLITHKIFMVWTLITIIKCTGNQLGSYSSRIHIQPSDNLDLNRKSYVRKIMTVIFHRDKPQGVSVWDTSKAHRIQVYILECSKRTSTACNCMKMRTKIPFMELTARNIDVTGMFCSWKMVSYISETRHMTPQNNTIEKNLWIIVEIPLALRDAHNYTSVY